jgi:hypothetical protein
MALLSVSADIHNKGSSGVQGVQGERRYALSATRANTSVILLSYKGEGVSQSF